MEVLFSKEKISARVAELAKVITSDFAGKDFSVLGVLKGAFVFMADLMRDIDAKVEVDFIRVASYHSGTRSSGNIKITKDIEIDISGRNVLVVEDILDSGFTMNFLKTWLEAKKPCSIKFCVLIDKQERREVPFTADYVGFTIPDGFVVGYGLDCNETFRNLPDIFIITE